MRWSLTDLYTGIDSDEFKKDFEEAKQVLKSFNVWSEENLQDISNPSEKIESFLNQYNDLEKYTKMSSFCNLLLSVDSLDEKAAKTLDSLEEMFTELSKPQVMFEKFVAQIQNLEEVIESSEIIEQHKFYLMDIKDKSKYLLSEAEEVIIAKLINTGSGAWTKMRDQLTSTLLVEAPDDGEIKKIPLTIVRNMAYSRNPEIRKNAYFAELKAYEKIDKAIAFALNGIKGEVLTISKMRGYASPLEMTLLNSRMDRETLDAMLSAILDYLPWFSKYFRKKASLLGHNNGLPFYDMFAPIGKSNLNFTYNEASEYVIKNFSAFSQKLGGYAKKAFENNWLDVEPRNGKRGGAFCSNFHAIKQSRIMANFTGSLNDVLTLAHELGHGYHGFCLVNETYINCRYPMPIAETASTFCETLVLNAALKNASKEEALTILEQQISDAAQIIIDIYSRFLFEDEVFKRRQNGSLSVSELNEIMLESQKKAYGDGLDPEYLHHYMWIPKTHYYYSARNYYNFPYAYGLLFSNGLYSLYLKDGEKFVERYDDLLAATGKNNLADVGKLAGIDVHNKDFWASSLQLVADNIEKFCNL